MENGGESPPTAQQGDSQVEVTHVTKPVVRVPFEESIIGGERRKRHQLQHVITTSMVRISITTVMKVAVAMYRF